MDETLAISGLECVNALLLEGFSVVRRFGSATVLRRSGKLVIVPDALVLAKPVVDAILDEAHVSHERFLELLSDEPTLTEGRTLG